MASNHWFDTLGVPGGGIEQLQFLMYHLPKRALGFFISTAHVLAKRVGDTAPAVATTGGIFLVY